MELAIRDGKITSLDLVKEINLFRSQIEGNPGVQHDSLLKMIRDEFEEEIGVGELNASSYKSNQNKSLPMFLLTVSQAKQLLVRESKVVRRAVIKRLDELESVKPKELTDDELIIKVMATLQLRIEQQRKEAEEKVSFKNSRLHIVGGTLGGTKRSLNSTKKKLNSELSHKEELFGMTRDEIEYMNRENSQLRSENKRLRVWKNSHEE